MEIKEKKNRRSCRDDALFWLEYGDRTEKEMVQRLKKKGYSEREIAETMEFLKEYSLMDDERYALKFVEMAMEKGRGPLRIRHQLQEKGISSAVADAAISQLYDRTTEREIALRVAEKAMRVVCGDFGGGFGDSDDLDDPNGNLRGEMDESRKPARRLTEKERMKIARRLAAAGFSAQAAFDAINRLK